LTGIAERTGPGRGARPRPIARGAAGAKWCAGLLAALVWLSGAACGGASDDAPGSPTPGATTAVRKTVQVVADHPHDRGAFTQGLLLHGGSLFESTGLNGRSSVREVEPGSGRVLRSTALPSELFGEGLAQVEDRLVQLTWTSGIARIYDLASFDLVGEWRYQGEGWGLCHDGERFVMSNGSSRLAFRDDETFAETGGVDVTLDGRRLGALNELECVDGKVYANVWRTDSIAEIDPATGVVTSYVDASGLLSESERAGTDVLNGIAWDPGRQSFYLTGKLWPRLFEVRFVAP
jgi:glutaminyl-peptide cyclotransferase